MNYFFKTYLLWLLVAVLPLQAVGATMSSSCGPVHHKAMQVASLNSMQHQHHDATDTAHSHHHDAATMVSSASDDGGADNASSGTHQYSTCGSCTASCIGATAPPSAPGLTPTVSGSEMVTVAPASLVTGHTPAGLERPPKHLIA